MTGLSPVLRRELKARAHSLKAVVLIGAAGLTPAVLLEIERNLKAHELIKVRAAGSDRAARGELLGEICAKTGAQPVQSIGKILVVFRENPERRKRESGPTQQDKAPARRKAAFTRSARR